MNITTNDKFIAVKETWFMNEGTVINVTNVDSNIVSFAFNEDETKRGYMDMATFETHFKKIEDNPVTTAPTITVEEIADIVDDIMENSEFEIHNAFGICTTVYCRLPNGYIITESYSCANGDYDEELAQEICHDKIWDRVWNQNPTDCIAKCIKKRRAIVEIAKIVLATQRVAKMKSKSKKNVLANATIAVSVSTV